MKYVLLLLVLTGTAIAQEFPDAPSASSSLSGTMCQQGSSIDEQGNVTYKEVFCEGIPQWPEHKYRAGYSATPLSWKKTFNGKLFWTMHGIGALGIVADEYVTLRGESHGCLEQGNSGGYHVSFGRMGTVDWATFGGVTIFDLFLRKINIRIAPYTTPLVLGAKHGLGVYHWTQTNCL
jgi:hypothetical protein